MTCNSLATWLSTQFCEFELSKIIASVCLPQNSPTFTTHFWSGLDQQQSFNSGMQRLDRLTYSLTVRIAGEALDKIGHK